MLGAGDALSPALEDRDGLVEVLDGEGNVCEVERVHGELGVARCLAEGLRC